MRWHVTEKQRRINEASKRRDQLLAQLAHDDVEAPHLLIQELDAALSEIRQAGELADDCSCSGCNCTFEKSSHVSVTVHSVTAERGDASALFKDFSPDNRPALILCAECAIGLGVVTQGELDSGVRSA